MIDNLIDIHGLAIPYHEPSMYRAAAIKTKSVPGFSTLAFPDFWGQVPPPENEPMAPRKPNIQRYADSQHEHCCCNCSSSRETYKTVKKSILNTKE